MGQVVEGRYIGRAVEARLCETKAGKPQVVTTLELKTGPSAEDFGVIHHYGSLVGGATQYTLQALRALGWQGDDVSDLRGITDNEVEVVVKTEVYEGKSKLVASIFKPGSAFGKDMDDAKKAQIVKDLRAAAIRSRQGEAAPSGGGYAAPAKSAAPTQRAAARTASGAPVGDDYIPFALLLPLGLSLAMAFGIA